MMQRISSSSSSSSFLSSSSSSSSSSRRCHLHNNHHYVILIIILDIIIMIMTIIITANIHNHFGNRASKFVCYLPSQILDEPLHYSHFLKRMRNFFDEKRVTTDFTKFQKPTGYSHHSQIKVSVLTSIDSALIFPLPPPQNI